MTDGRDYARSIDMTVKGRLALARRTVRGSIRVDRNALCECGSRRKFKHCCGAASGSVKRPALPKESPKVKP